MRSIPTSLLFAAALAVTLPAQESKYELPAEERTGSIKRILVLSHSHLDIGFTRPPDEVARDYKDNIDEAIRLTREHPDFRWTIEEAWMLEEWLRRTDDAALIAELGKMLQSGRMGFGVTFASMHSGLMSTEEANRLVYLGHKFRTRFGLRSAVALQNDVPGFTWAYPRILAASGVRRLILGLNLFIGGGNNLGVSQNPFYWVGPDGSRVLTYFTYDSYVEGYRWKLTGRSTVEELEKSVPRRLAWLEKNGYKYDTYLLMASPGDNTPPVSAYRVLERMREWNRRHPETPLQMATAEEFFDYLVQKYGDNFPSARGDATGHWETVKLRVPEAAGRMRQLSNVLPASETAAALSTLLTRRPYPKYDLNEAWYSLLSFHEHTADAGGGWPGYFSRWDADWSNTAHYSAALAGYSNAEQTLRRSILRLASPGDEHTLVNPVASRAEAAAVIVYNGLSWPRSGPVTVERLPSALRDGPLKVTDLATGETVAWEPVPGTNRQITLFAKEVPAIGYKVYRVEKGSGQVSPARQQPFPIKVEWNAAGWITSIAETSGVRELKPQNADQPLGRILVSGRREEFRADETGPPRVTVTEGPLTRRIEMARSGSPLPLAVITLYRDAAYADMRFDVDLGFVRDITRGDCRYGIALPFRSEQTYLDGAGFITKVPDEILPGGRAPQFTPVHFVHYAQQGWGATVANIDAAILNPDKTFVLAAESMNAETREEGLQRLFRAEPRSTPVQSFRFRVAIQGADRAEWKRFGAEANLPLRAVVAGSVPVTPQRGFFELDHASVQMLAFKPAESRPGWHVIRLQETGGREVKGARLKSALKILKAEAANLVEEGNGTPVDLANISLRPWETMTALVQVQP